MRVQGPLASGGSRAEPSPFLLCSVGVKAPEILSIVIGREV